jgi:hypothetical protein
MLSPVIARRDVLSRQSNLNLREIASGEKQERPRNDKLEKYEKNNPIPLFHFFTHGLPERRHTTSINSHPCVSGYAYSDSIHIDARGHIHAYADCHT